MAVVGILRIFMIMVRFYFPTCTLNWVQARTRAPMGVCHPSPLKMGKGRQRQTRVGTHCYTPSDTNFRLTFLLTRLQEALYEDLPVHY